MTSSCNKKNLSLGTIICLVLLLSFNSLSFSQKVIPDTLFDHSALHADTVKVINTGQDQSVSFFRRDSIFSFHSQKGYFPSLLHDFAHQATAPLHFGAKEWLITGASIGVTAILLSLDHDIDSWATKQKQEHNWIKVSSPVITEFGNRYGIGLVVAVGSVSAILNKEKGVQTSLLATQAMITSGAWVRLIKLLTGRERPKGAYIYSHDEAGRWYGPFAEFNHKLAHNKSIFAFDAFPSGHTAVAFSIATVFASEYNDTWVVPAFCYSAATAVGVTRLIEHEHWASDVFVGGLFGYICGKQVVNHFNNIHRNPGNSSSQQYKRRPAITLIQNGNQIGLSMKW
jgi:membrane-associated phospholipid phosphatase